jgi:Flp pilus assembly protein TadD
MNSHHRNADRKPEFRSLGQSFPRMVVMIAALCLHPPLMASGQTTPQIQINDAAPDESIPTETIAAKRLSDLVNNRNWSEAESLAQALVRQEPNDPAVHYYLGLILVHFDDPVGAIRALRVAEHMGMDTAYFHQVLGIAYYNVHQFVLFEQQMDKSIALAPADYKPYFYRGRYLESVRNDFPAALEDFARASLLNPAHAESWYYQGYCLESSGRRQEARVAYEAAIKSVEETHQQFSLPDQGIARLLTDEAPGQALEFARKAVELEPEVDSNHLVMAKIYERLGRYSDAEVELQCAERLNPINAAPRFMLARIYTKAGDQKAAEAELEMFKRINRTYGSQ